ncbi:MAG TPA: sugar ABC transporter ATP-binding protein [Conexibacter sp.]|nr:sugar ABC transporter ATP-binding protein [Conexibacter sp.]
MNPERTGAPAGAPSAGGPPPALELESITKRFGGVTALSDATVRVRRGEVHGLVGENGAGKSTLLKILDGQHPHGSYEGVVRVDGEVVELGAPQDARRLGIAIVPQETSVVETLSVGENICFGEGGGPLADVRAMERHAAAIIERLALRLDARTKVARLSSSQKQLVMIARALYREPRVLILDEPTSALTAEETARLFALVRQLRDGGLTCIFVSHRLDEVSELCDRVSILRDGRVVDELARADFDVERIIGSMIGRRLTDLYPERSGAAAADAERPAALTVEQLSIRHPEHPGDFVVRDVSFTVAAGEVLGVGGLVGSGRSELLGAIYGRLPLAAGRVLLDGEELNVSSPREALAAGIGLVTEDRKRDGLLFNLGLRENVTLAYLRSLGSVVIDRGRERAMAQQAVRQFSIVTRSVETPVGQLSGGNQQKVMLARALERGPRVLLLDEPTVGVDVGAKAEIYRLIRALADAGVAVVVVSSESAELLGICDRFVVLRDGAVRDRFGLSEASEERLMTAAMAARPAAPTSTEEER